MGCGPINDQHKYGGNPGEDAKYHRFFSKKGGFLGVTIEKGKARAEWFTSNEIDQVTGKPKVRYTEKLGH